jgi:hypothetical protein
MKTEGATGRSLAHLIVEKRAQRSFGAPALQEVDTRLLALLLADGAQGHAYRGLQRGQGGGHRWHNSVKLTQSVCCCFPAADAVSGTGEANKALPCARVSHGSAGLTGSWRNGQAFPLVHKPRAK